MIPGHSDCHTEKPLLLCGQLCVDSILQSLTSLELGSLGSLNLHGLTGMRVTSLSCCSLGNLESTKSNDLNLIAILKLFSDGICKSLHCILSVLLGKSRLLSDCSYQFGLIHYVYPPESKMGQCPFTY